MGALHADGSPMGEETGGTPVLALWAPMGLFKVYGTGPYVSPISLPWVSLRFMVVAHMLAQFFSHGFLVGIPPGFHGFRIFPWVSHGTLERKVYNAGL